MIGTYSLSFKAEFSNPFSSSYQKCISKINKTTIENQSAKRCTSIALVWIMIEVGIRDGKKELGKKL